MNGREEGGQYYILQTCDQERFEARKVVFPWECLIIFATGCSFLVPLECYRLYEIDAVIHSHQIRHNHPENTGFGCLSCVAWRFWLDAQSNKGGREQKDREEIWAGATRNLLFSRLHRSYARVFARSQQNRRATQAIGCPSL